LEYLRANEKDQIIDWLKMDDQDEFEKLWRQSDDIRRDNVGDEAHLRGLIEVPISARAIAVTEFGW
jgi:hypothetical protein